MNPVAAVIEILRADTDVQALADQRIYGEELPRTEAPQMPRPAVVVRATGGGSLGPGASSYVPWQVTRMDCHCYGQTFYQASQVQQAVYSAMTGLRHTVAQQTAVKNATVSGGPLSGRDPDTDWPRVLIVFDVHATPAP